MYGVSQWTHMGGYTHMLGFSKVAWLVGAAKAWKVVCPRTRLKHDFLLRLVMHAFESKCFGREED